MPIKTLSDRQRQCVVLSATMTDKEIGRELGIRPGTVNKHIQEAMDRLEVNTRKGALRALGYTAPPPSHPLSPDPAEEPNERAETDSDARPPRPRSSASFRYAPPPRGIVLRLAIAFAFLIGGSIVAIGSAAILNAGLGLTQQMAPAEVR